MRNENTKLFTAQDCSVSRGGRDLLHRVNLSVDAGDCIWVIGPNGVGKSSLLRLAAGLLRPQEGVVNWTGGDPAKCLSYQGHYDAVWPELTVDEVLKFWRDLSSAAHDLSAIKSRLNLHALSAQACRTLSAGQSRRVALAKLLIEDKPLWLMDEPTAPLDADSRDLAQTLMAEHLDKGGAIIVASHSKPIKIGRADRVLRLGPQVAV